MTYTNAVDPRTATVATAERAGITPPGVEDELRLLRRAVRRREGSASADALRRRVAELSTDVEVLQVIDGYQRDPDGARPRVVALADRTSGRVPSDADAARDQSILLLYAGRRELAASTARAALARHPGDVGLLLVVLEAVIPDGDAAVAGVVRDLVCDPAMAVELLAELEEVPSSAELHYWLAVGAIDAGRAVLALEVVGRALAAEPDDLRLLSIRLHCLILLDRADEALQEADALLEREPSLLAARLDRASALARLGRGDEAIAALDELPEGELGTAARCDVAALRIEVLVRVGLAGEALVFANRAAAEHPGEVRFATAQVDALLAVNKWEEALAVVVEARRAHPESAGLRTAHAAILRHLGRLDDALDVLGDAITADPFDIAAQVSRAEVLDELGRAEEAITALEKATARDPGNVTVAERRAKLLFSMHRYVEALDTIEEARAGGTETPELLTRRAQVLVSLERYDEAAACFESLLDTATGMGEDASRAAEGGARQIASAGRIDDALKLLEHVDARYQLSADGHALIAELLRLANRCPEAIGHADTALASSVTDRVQVLGTKSMALIALARSAEALDVIDEALRAYDGYLFGWMARSGALYSLERPNEALEILEQHFPAGAIPEGWDEWVLGFKAAIISAIGRHDEAIAVLEPALDAALRHYGEGDGSGLLRTNLGFLYIRQRRFADALDVMEPTRGEDPKEWSPWALNNLAIALILVGDADDGDELQRIFERELRLASASVAPESRAVAGWSQFWLGRHADAIASIDTVLSMRRDPLLQIRMGMGLLLFGMGQAERAEREIRQVLVEADRLADQMRAAEILSYGRWLSEVLVQAGRLPEIPATLRGERTPAQ